MRHVVVGAGLTGATVARSLADAGRDVVVYERRDRVGGNAHDYLHGSGIRVGSHGPHYFRTSSRRVWDFVGRFADWRPFEARVMTLGPGGLTRWPLQRGHVEKISPGWEPEGGSHPENFEEACLAMMPPEVYDRFVRHYTEKQWGRPVRSLAASLAGRFDVRDGDDRLRQNRWQALPAAGYTAMVGEMLRGITVVHGDWVSDRRGDIIVYTGPIDEYFGFRLGCLEYRRQRRVTRYLPDRWHQQVVQINNPSLGTDIRTIEWKHMMPDEDARRADGTVVTTEYPEDAIAPDECEYPIPDARNTALRARYRELAEREMPRTTFCGRLGTYRYLDMDQAIAQALKVAGRLL